MSAPGAAMAAMAYASKFCGADTNSSDIFLGTISVPILGHFVAKHLRDQVALNSQQNSGTGSI